MSQLSSAAALPDFPKVIHVYPNRVGVEQMLSRSQGCVTTDAYFTFETLTTAVAPRVDKRFASSWLGRLLVRDILVEKARERHTSTFAAMARDPHSVSSVHRSLSELRAAGLSAHDLERDNVSQELQDLVVILRAYEQLLEHGHLFDDAGRQRMAIDAVRAHRWPASFKQLQRIVVHGASSLFGSRLDLLRAFVDCGVHVTLQMPYDADRAALFAWCEASMARLETCFDLDVDVECDPRTGDGVLAELRAAQFTHETISCPDLALIQMPPGPAHARGVAWQVQRWLQEGMAPSEIAVVLPSGESLGEAIVSALDNLGISAYDRAGIALAGTAASRFVCHSLRLADDGFLREALLDYLACLGPAADEAHWLRRAGIHSEHISDYAKSLKREAQKYGEYASGADAQAAYIALEQSLIAVMDEIATCPKNGTLTEFIAWLEAQRAKHAPRYLDVMNVSAHSADVDGAWYERRTWLRAHGQAAEAWRAVGEVLEGIRTASIAAAQAAHEFPLTRPEAAQWIEFFLSELRPLPLGTRSGAVAVLSPQDVAETQYRAMIFVGASKGVFPAMSGSKDPILTDELRIEINKLCGQPRLLQYAPASGKGFVSAESRDLALWVEALASVQEKLTVTFSAGPEQDPEDLSGVVSELLRSTGQTPVSIEMSGLAPTYRTTSQHAHPPETHAIRLQREQLRSSGATDLPANAKARNAIAQHFAEVMHSPSGLDVLGSCAFKYFANTVLKVATVDIPELGVEPREDGNIAHRALEVVYRDMMQQGGLQEARRNVNAAMSRARQVYDQHRQEILSSVRMHPHLRDAVWQETWRHIEKLLMHDLDDGCQQEVIEVEYKFTGSGALDLVHPETHQHLRVRGSIDRVDRVAKDALWVIDYKRKRPTKEPRQFQLGIYGLVALRDFAKRQPVNEVRALWWGLRDSSAKPRDAEDEHSVQAFVDSVTARIWERVEHVQHGNIAPDPTTAKTCTYCDYAALCRFAAKDAALDGDDNDSENEDGAL